MFFGQNNNSDNVVSTNTTITTMYSDLSSLVIGAWNDKINLKFSPSIGKDANGLNQYDREKRANTALTQSNSVALLEKYKKEILPKVQAKEDIGTGINVAVSMGRSNAKNILMIEYKPDENGENRFYLTFAQNVSDDGKVSDENKISYKFNQTETMTNYDPSTGAGDLSKEESEFENFIHILEHHTDILPMVAHSIRHSNEIGKRYANRSNNNSSSGFGNQMDSFNMGMPEELPFN